MTKRVLSLLVIFVFIGISNLYCQTTQEGMASYYAKKFHKRKSASGEIYNQDSLVCAHRTLPFGTMLEVYNPETDKTVVVRVIDRGPFAKKRIIDLSPAAAKELEFIQSGVAKVQIKEYIPMIFKPLGNIEKITIDLLNIPKLILKHKKIKPLS